MNFMLGITKEGDKQVQIEAADIVALGILSLAIAASFVACVTVIGLVWGKVSEGAATWIIGTCVGGAAISGIVSKLMVRKSKSKR